MGTSLVDRAVILLSGPGYPLAGRAASRKGLDSGVRRNDGAQDNYETVNNMATKNMANTDEERS
jgi:hypothetical protein